MSGYVQNASPVVTATIYGFRGQQPTGELVAAYIQQYALENDRQFAVARHTDSTGDSYWIGLTSSYKSGQIAVVPSLDEPRLRFDQSYKLLQVVTCSWGGSFDVMQGIGSFMSSVSGLADYLEENLGRRTDNAPHYQPTDFANHPSFDPEIYLF
jgi:hypothetical protein